MGGCSDHGPGCGGCGGCGGCARIATAVIVARTVAANGGGIRDRIAYSTVESNL